MSKKRLIKAMTVVAVTTSFSIFYHEQANADNLKTEYKNPAPAKKGGTLKVGYVNDGSFKGVFAPELSNDAATSDVATFGQMGLFKTDDNYKYIKGGLADVTFDRNEKTATIKISNKAKWSDGQPVVARDLVYAYEILANKDSGSARYTDELANIEGMEAYHNGQAEAISGLEIRNDQELVVHFQKMVPAMETSGSGYLWEYAEPYHYLKDVAMKDLAASQKIRKRPLFYGPFKIQKMVQGESLEWTPNKYYATKPKLQKITLEMVGTSQAAAAIQANKYDLVLNQDSQTYNKVKKDKDVVQIGKKMLYYSYLGFRVGKRDQDGNSVMDKTAPANDKALRQALAYAMNVDQVNAKFGYGLTYRANTLVPDAFGKWNAKNEKGYRLNMKKAKALLDKAGYKLQKDGYRTRPDGKKLTLVLLANKSSKNFEATVTNYIQQWKELGVRVRLQNGRLQEFNTMTEKLMSGATDFDMWFGAWSTSSEPTDIANTYKASATYNISHFVTKENTALIDSLSSEQAFDDKYRQEQFYKWQKYMNDQAFIVPNSFRTQTVTVGKNVKGMTLDVEKGYTLWSDVALTK